VKNRKLLCRVENRALLLRGIIAAVILSVVWIYVWLIRGWIEPQDGLASISTFSITLFVLVLTMTFAFSQLSLRYFAPSISVFEDRCRQVYLGVLGVSAVMPIIAHASDLQLLPGISMILLIFALALLPWYLEETRCLHLPRGLLRYLYSKILDELSTKDEPQINEMMQNIHDLTMGACRDGHYNIMSFGLAKLACLVNQSHCLGKSKWTTSIYASMRRIAENCVNDKSAFNKACYNISRVKDINTHSASRELERLCIYAIKKHNPDSAIVPLFYLVQRKGYDTEDFLAKLALDGMRSSGRERRDTISVIVYGAKMLEEALHRRTDLVTIDHVIERASSKTTEDELSSFDCFCRQLRSVKRLAKGSIYSWTVG